MGIDNNIDWTAPSVPHGEHSGPGPVRKTRSSVQKASQHPAGEVAVSRRQVMDTLLGENTLAAFDAGGNDPYNATGRQFRR